MKISRRKVLLGGALAAAPLAQAGARSRGPRGGGASVSSGGGPATTLAGSPYAAQQQVGVVLPVPRDPVAGVVNLTATNNINTAVNLTFVWTIHGPGGVYRESPVLVAPLTSNLSWAFDTTTVPDGTYIIYPRFLDSDGGYSLQIIQACGEPLIIANGGLPASTAAQSVPCAPNWHYRPYVPRPDFVNYNPADGPYPLRNTTPITYSFVAPANSPASPYYPSSPTLRNQSEWYAESQPGPGPALYFGLQQFVTTKTGGVSVELLGPFFYELTETSYDGVTKNNTMDGTRLNSLVSPYSNFVEHPTIGAEWWGVEINGRLLKIDRQGGVTTIFGPKRDRTRLTLNMDLPSVSVEDVEDIRSYVGTNAFGTDEMNGANDLCFDPRDPNILYVAVQLDHWIAKINLTTLVCTVYAGTPGAAGHVDGLVASVPTKFDQPTSICIRAAAHGSEPIGTMYVADGLNHALRRISPDGTTVSTVCGKTVGPALPALSTVVARGAVHNVIGTIAWNNATQLSGTVTVAAYGTPPLVPGQTLALSGSSNDGGSDVNTDPGGGRFFVVSTVSDSTHFTLTTDRFLGSPHPPIGTLSGSMTLTELNQDFYSPPGSVTFANAYLPLPAVCRLTSAGGIVVGEAATRANRLIDTAAGTISRRGCWGNYLSNHIDLTWYFLDVDINGTCGPVDDIIACDASSRDRIWRSSLAVGALPGRPVYGETFVTDNGGAGLPNLAPANLIYAGPGHYPWAIAISRLEGRMITTGVADWQPTMYRIKQAADPAVSNGVNWNQPAFERGYDVNFTGAPPGFPWEIRPSFYALWGQLGVAFHGNRPGANTFEDLMATYPTDGLPGNPGTGLCAPGTLGRYIQDGMGGSVPRPELTGNTLRDFIYFIRRSTLQGSLGPTPIPPGASDPDTTAPIITSCDAVRDSPAQITVSWQTNKPAIGFAGAGSANQVGNFAYYPMFSAVESGYSTSHSMPVAVVPSLTPIHFTAIAKDIAGNIVHTADKTVA